MAVDPGPAVTEHGAVLLRCAQQLLQRCKYVDVALTIQGQRIFCHRLVLVSYSGYFDALFTNFSLLPGATYDACLDDLGVNLGVFNVLLNFMYSGHLTAEGCSLDELQKTADLLKIERASEVLQGMIDEQETQQEQQEPSRRQSVRQVRKAKAKQKIHGHKRKKKKQDRPVKIQKLSEEETAQLARIKTEVLESESLLDPTSGTIVEKQSAVDPSQLSNTAENFPTDEAMTAVSFAVPASIDWTGLDDPEVGSDPTLEDKDLQVPPEDAQRRISPNSELPDKEQVVEASREETENDAGEQDDAAESTEGAKEISITVKKKRGRPKCTSKKRGSEATTVAKKKRKSDAPRKMFVCGMMTKAPNVTNVSIRSYKQDDGAFHCDQCDFTSTVDKTFRLHVRRHTGEKPYTCSICGKGFIDSKYLGDHVRVHTGERPYSCEICAARFKAKKHLSRHKLTHIETRDHQCDQCAAAFKSSTQLREHIARIHNKLRPHKCDFPGCAYAGFTPYDLKMHKEKHGLRDSAQSILCDFCGKVFHRFGSLKAHLKLHSNKLEKCGHCEFTSPYKQVVLHHSMRHHGVDLNNVPVERTLKCDLCDFAAFTKQEYDIHMYKHSGYRPHKCPICNFAAVDKGTITKHLRVHTGDLPFSCKTCGKQFTQQSGLARHKRIHLGIKPHECPKCMRRYADRKSLRIHMFTHAAVKPFVCHICSQGYVRKDILANHISKKHGPEMVPLEMRPQQKPRPLQVSKSELDQMYSGVSVSVSQTAPALQVSLPAVPLVPQVQQQQQPPAPNPNPLPDGTAVVQTPVVVAQVASTVSALPSHSQANPIQNSGPVATAPLVTSTQFPNVTSAVITQQNVRVFSDLTGETTSLPVDSVISQAGLELSTIDPSSHHQLLGHMPLVATSSGSVVGHMGGTADSGSVGAGMAPPPPPHQSGTAVISQLIHPNTYISGLSNTMSMPPHLSHAHPHYQM